MGSPHLEDLAATTAVDSSSWLDAPQPSGAMNNPGPPRQAVYRPPNQQRSGWVGKSKSSSLRAKARAVASRGRLLLIATRGCKILTRSSTMLATPKTSTMQIYKDHSLATCKLKLSQPGRPVCWSSGHSRDKHSTNRQIPQLGHLLAQAVFHKVLIATCILQTKSITGRPYL